ncbi:uncharacterized protein LOC132789564 [Drosophila nasuta]|uniref:uncharacterized protein LOC132789564 n=1 Tax=Drosophila nasuta TaxID=42062 RepID=UPI00295EE879|nr:uncharacterized protein LOC132789564 [Drosophila nasuta]
MKLLLLCCLLLAVTLCRSSVIPTVPVAAPVPVPGVLPVPTSHQFVTRHYNGLYVPTTTTSTAWPAWSTYPTTYYKYGGGYPTYTYPYSYSYGYYPGYNYGYGYKSSW